MEEIVAVIENTKPQDVDLKLMKIYMRIDFADEENDMFLNIIIKAAKSFVQSYLNWNFVDAGENIPLEITLAVMAIAEHWYKNRGVLNEEKSMREIPYVFSGILDMHRSWNASGVDYK